MLNIYNKSRTQKESEMEPGEAVVLSSENQDFLGEDSKKSALGDNFPHSNYFNHHDEYSDIYFDKSCANLDEMSA